MPQRLENFLTSKKYIHCLPQNHLHPATAELLTRYLYLLATLFADFYIPSNKYAVHSSRILLNIKGMYSLIPLKE